jgi:putative endonuclease
MAHYVYILYSSQHDRFYIGQTNDLIDRFSRHNAGMVLNTKPYLPWDFVWACEKPNRAEAMALERKLKNLGRERLQQFMEKYESIPFPTIRRGRM